MSIPDFGSFTVHIDEGLEVSGEGDSVPTSLEIQL